MHAMLARFGALFLMAAFAAGCTYPAATLPIVANGNVGAAPKLVKRNVEGEDCVYRVLGLIPTSRHWTPSVEDAMEDAMQGGDGNVLTDVVWYGDLTYTILWSKECLIVKGDLGKL